MAQESADQRAHRWIWTEDLLRALLHEGRAAVVLAKLRASTDTVEAAIVSVPDREERERSLVRPGYRSSRTKQVVLVASAESRRLGAEHLSAEHLLLGLLLEGESVAASVLARLGITLDKVRSELASLAE